jgi:chemotaxis protein MotA
MDIGAIIGLAVGIGGILVGYILEGGNPASLLHEASPLFIVFGGTFGSAILHFPFEELKKIPGALKVAFTIKKHDAIGIINKLAALSEKARKDGLLSLEQDAQNDENDLIRKGLGLVVDGIETEVIKDILIREVELKESINESAAKIFDAAGGYAPTFGVLGTVMGMVQVLGTMSDNPDDLGGKIAIAFLATFFGVASANVLYLPIGGRIKAKAEAERMVNDLIIEGLLSIQAGENPRIIKEKLNLTLMKKLQGKGKGKGEEAGKEELRPEMEG